MELPEVTQAAPAGAGAAARYRIRQSGQRPAVDLSVGIDAVRPHGQDTLRPAGLHMGDLHTALMGELVGAVGQLADPMRICLSVHFYICLL